MTHRLLGCLVLLVLRVAVSSGMEAGADTHLAFPRAYEPGTLRYSLGLSLTLLPRAVVEEEIRQIPMVNAALRWALPLNFSLTAGVSTVYITNVASAGVMWSQTHGGISFAVSDEFSYWFGVADMSGFDTQAMGLFNRPAVSAGVDIDSYKLTVKTEVLALLTQHTYFGSASVSRIKPEIAGIATTLFLEQDLWQSTSIMLAFRGNYARPNYQVWLAFSVQDVWLFYPELQAAVIF